MILDLRWVLHYSDGRKKIGLWSNGGDEKDKSTQAWAQSTEGLACACIEARNLQNPKRHVVMASVPGADFCCFNWMATAPLQYGWHQPKIVGMVLVSRTAEVVILRDGSVIPRARSFDDKIMCYGRT